MKRIEKLSSFHDDHWPVSVLGFYLEPHRFEVPNITEAKLEVIGNIYENPTLLESN